MPTRYRGQVTAHPKIDPETGEMVLFAYSASATCRSQRTVSYGVTDAAGKVVAPRRFRGALLQHGARLPGDRGATSLFPILPLTGSLERAMTGGPAFAWEPDKGAFVGVMAPRRRRRDDPLVRDRPSYVFHPMNAWEEGDKIFADVMEYPTAPLFPNADGTAHERTVGAGWCAGPSTWRTTPTRSSASRSTTWPANSRASTSAAPGLAYRHGWFAANYRARRRIALRRHRPCRSRHRQADATTSSPEGDAAGEPIFVPRTADADEGRRLASRGDLSRRRGPQRPRGVRGPGHRRRPDRHGRAAAPRALRLPRQLAEGLGRITSRARAAFQRRCGSRRLSIVCLRATWPPPP